MNLRGCCGRRWGARIRAGPAVMVARGAIAISATRRLGAATRAPCRRMTGFASVSGGRSEPEVRALGRITATRRTLTRRRCCCRSRDGVWCCVSRSRSSRWSWAAGWVMVVVMGSLLGRTGTGDVAIGHHCGWPPREPVVRRDARLEALAPGADRPAQPARRRPSRSAKVRALARRRRRRSPTREGSVATCTGAG